MSIKNIENLISNLIKDGDKETISTVIELLEEIRDFKKETKNSVRTFKPTEKPKVVEKMTTEEHANTLLDHFYATGGQKHTPKMISYPSLNPTSSIDSAGIDDQLVNAAPDNPELDDYLNLLM